jgi:hypothetical protein
LSAWSPSASTMSAMGHPARMSGMMTGRSGARIAAVSAMKWTPQNTIMRALEAAACRDKPSESPTKSATS